MARLTGTRAENGRGSALGRTERTTTRERSKRVLEFGENVIRDGVLCSIAMALVEQYRSELLALGIVSAVTVGVLEGFHFQGEVLLAKVVALAFVIALVSVSVLRVIAVAEGVFLLEGAAVSVLAPLLFEVSLRFELIGVIMAVGFVAGVGLNRLFGRIEPDDRSTTKAKSDAR